VHLFDIVPAGFVIFLFLLNLKCLWVLRKALSNKMYYYYYYY